MEKILILYAYCENQKGDLANDNSKYNLEFFLNNSLIDDNNYFYYININGKYNFNFKKYLKKYNNLKILEYDGKCQLEGYINIFNNINYNNFNYFFFLQIR